MEDEGTYGEGRGAASIIYGVREAAALTALVTVVRAVWRGSRARRSDSEAKTSCEIRETECTLADTVTPPSLFRKEESSIPDDSGRRTESADASKSLVVSDGALRRTLGGTGNTDWGRLSGHTFSNIHVHTCALAVDFTSYGLLPVPGVYIYVRWKDRKESGRRVGGGGHLCFWVLLFRRDGLGVGQAGRGAGQEMAGDRYKEAKEVSVGRERQGPIKRIASTIMEEGDFGDWALEDLEPERD
ncbi:hypothetical protein EDB92DRAFT_1815694 [Lactarius akahatsu]|uniref:Uncharacterized protein n=1 Tax=Lactarius akahatsu TaxID=416441 RepID=A0AAD4LKV3_9AGAM|nr:hypothetical protein EDB92DRAFT_1815694 [Lactarius akahatsu]